MRVNSSLLFCFFTLSCMSHALTGNDAVVNTSSILVTVAASSTGANSTTRDLAIPTLSTVKTTQDILNAKAVGTTTVSSFPLTSKWNVSDENGNICILLQSAIRITFGYISKDTGIYEKGVIDVLSSAEAEGTCGSRFQTISLLFNNDWNLTFTFTKNNSEYYMSSALFYYNIQNGHSPFPDAVSYHNRSVYVITQDEDNGFQTDVGKSCVCTSQTTVLNDVTLDSVGVLRVDLYDTRVEAFRINVTNTDFSAMGSRCDNDELSMLVPIVVGACLAGLIVFVLVAYFIGRHRSKRGYLNVL